MRKLVSLLFAGGFLMVGGTSVLAHHSFTAEFDVNKPVQVTGNITKVEFINPHSWIYVDVKKPDGTTENWAFEAGTPNTLLRRGLKKTDLPAGTKVTIFGYQSRDGGARANAANLTLADGRALFLGSGSPNEQPK
jgi:Family of unknown function (DUF6152)